MNWKEIKILVTGTWLWLAATTWLQAQHYPAGSEGIKGATLPPPGFYFEDYNSFYFYHKVPGFGGQLQTGFDQYSYTQSPRLMWVTPWKLLGADLGAAVRIPFTWQEYTRNVLHVVPPNLQPGIGPANLGSFFYAKTTDAHFGLSDIQIEPLILAWHWKQIDAVASYSFWAPTGDFPGGADNQNTGYLFYTLGQVYWTHMFTLGATWYCDAKKTWAISLLNRYEINTEQYSGLYNEPGGVESLGTTLGDIYTLEWALSKTILKGVDIGVTGYYQQQVTATDGPTPNGPTWEGERIHVAGIGPEISATSPQWGLTGSLRYAYEFSAMDHPQGQVIHLTLTKSF